MLRTDNTVIIHKWQSKDNSKSYKWQPKEDITTYELAMCMSLLVIYNDGFFPLDQVELSDELRRHFIRVE